MRSRSASGTMEADGAVHNYSPDLSIRKATRKSTENTFGTKALRKLQNFSHFFFFFNFSHLTNFHIGKKLTPF
jgi:hypothetical protein